MISLTQSSPKTPPKKDGRAPTQSQSEQLVKYKPGYSIDSLVKDIVARRGTASGWLNVEVFGTNSVNPSVPFAFKYSVFSKLVFLVEEHRLELRAWQEDFKMSLGHPKLGEEVTSPWPHLGADISAQPSSTNLQRALVLLQQQMEPWQLMLEPPKITAKPVLGEL